MSLIVTGLVLLLALDGAAEGPTVSEETPDSGIEERVEVAAALPDVEDVAAFSTTLDGEEIMRRGEDLADALRRVPGAKVRDYGGLGSYATVSLRASTSEQVTVLVDGVQQNRALGGPVDLSSIPATQIERVTVYRGFGPAGYGLGGIGGVVDVRTRNPGNRPETRVDLLAGELATLRASSDFSFATGSTSHLRIGAELLRSDGDFSYLDGGAPFDPTDTVRRQRVNNDTEQQSVLLRHLWDQVGGGGLGLAFRLQRRDRGVPGIDRAPSETARLEEGLEDLNLNWNRERSPLGRVDLRMDVYRQSIDFVDREGDIGVGVQDNTTTLEGLGAVAMARPTLGRHGLLMRIDVRHEEARTSNRMLAEPDRGGLERDWIGLTLEDVFVVGGWTFAPSLRGEVRNDDAFGLTALFTPEDADGFDWAGKLGVARAVGANLTARGSIGRFYRMPSLLELFGDRGSVAGSASLLPESGKAAEAGVAWHRNRAGANYRVEAVLFGRRSENLIRWRPAAVGVIQAENIADADVFGLEIETSMRWKTGIGLDVAATLQDAKETSGFAEGIRLPYQAPVTVYAGASFEHGAISARWDVTYVGENSTTRLDIPGTELPERIVHDVAFSVVHGDLRFGIDIRNLFDREYRDLAEFPLPGRVLLLQFGWRSGGA